MNSLRRYLLPLCLPACLAGCISHHETVYQDEPRLRVSFESDHAARLFYETLHRGGEVRPKTESTTSFQIPVVLDHERKVVRGEHATFNAAVRRCDTNADGTITEQEARIFADHP